MIANQIEIPKSSLLGMQIILRYLKKYNLYNAFHEAYWHQHDSISAFTKFASRSSIYTCDFLNYILLWSYTPQGDTFWVNQCHAANNVLRKVFVDTKNGFAQNEVKTKQKYIAAVEAGIL